MKKVEVNDLEMELIKNSLELYKKRLEQKIKELDECSSHFFVNEGLMNEVRSEKEKIVKDLKILDKALLKFKMEHSNE